MKMGAICAGAMLAMTGWLGGSVAPAAAAEIKVMASAAIHDAYVELIPAFERASENKVVTEWVPTAEMMRRLKGGALVQWPTQQSAAPGRGLPSPADVNKDSRERQRPARDRQGPRHPGRVQRRALHDQREPVPVVGDQQVIHPGERGA